MAVAATRPVVGTTATLIASNPAAEFADFSTRAFAVKNATASAPVFLGDDTVTPESGFEWAVTDGPLEIDLEPSEELWGIISPDAPAPQLLHVLGHGR